MCVWVCGEQWERKVSLHRLRWDVHRFQIPESENQEVSVSLCYLKEDKCMAKRKDKIFWKLQLLPGSGTSGMTWEMGNKTR